MSNTRWCEDQHVLYATESDVELQEHLINWLQLMSARAQEYKNLFIIIIITFETKNDSNIFTTDSWLIDFKARLLSSQHLDNLFIISDNCTNYPQHNNIYIFFLNTVMPKTTVMLRWLAGPF